MKFLLAALLLAGMSVASAGDAPHPSQQAVQRLISLMQMDQMLDQMRGQMKKAMVLGAQQASNGKLDADEQAIVDKYLNNLSDVLFASLSDDKFKKVVFSMYADNFSEKEISDMIAFYQSETGQAMIRKMPAIMQQSSQFAMTMLADVRPQMDQLMKQMQSELAAVHDRKQQKQASPKS